MFSNNQNLSYVRRNLLPTTDAAFDLGSITFRFKNLYASESLYVGNNNGLRLLNSGGSAYDGTIKISTSNDLVYNIESSRAHIFQVNGGVNLTIDNGGCKAGFSGFNFGQDTLVTADTRYTCFSGCSTDSVARSGLIRTYGANAASSAGNVEIYTASVSGSSIVLDLQSSGTAAIYLRVGGIVKWYLDRATGTFANDATNGTDLVFNKLGTNIKVKEGSNGRMGQATLVAGTVTVSNTIVAANTRIILSRATIGGTVGNLSYTISAGASFTINSSNVLDTSVVTYLLVDPA